MRISDWSSDVCSSDLLCAADYLRQEHQAPAILIGHSLGGAAVLAAAGEVPEARAVATIAAPADAVHVVGNFKADLRSEERRVGKECVSTCRYRWSRLHYKTTQTTQ